jgi:hypothetical protein
MRDNERKMLVEAMVPFEVLFGQILHQPYKEMSVEFQRQLVESVAAMRVLLLEKK